MEVGEGAGVGGDPASSTAMGGGRRGGGGGKEGFWELLACPTASLRPAWGGRVGVFLFSPPPHLAPGGSLAGSGAEQAGGIFILEQHCRGGLVQELSVTAAAGEDPRCLPKLTPDQGARPRAAHGSPGGLSGPHAGTDSISVVFRTPTLSPAKEGVAPITLCERGDGYR